MKDNYTEKMLTIAAIWAVFVALTWGGMFSFISYQIIKSWYVGEKENDDIRKKHLQQHADEQVQYGRIIELQEEMIDILKKLEESKWYASY